MTVREWLRPEQTHDGRLRCRKTSFVQNLYCFMVQYEFRRGKCCNLQVGSLFHAAPCAIAVACTVIELHGLVDKNLLDVLGA